MRVLTIHQPFAWLIVRGLKRWENRPWQTQVRGPLLIHAGKSVTWWKKLDEDCRRHLPSMLPSKYPMGALVGAVNITDCVPVAEVRDEIFAWGPYCLRCDGAAQFADPIPWRGGQRFWNVDDVVVAGPLRLAGFVPMIRGRVA